MDIIKILEKKREENELKNKEIKIDTDKEVGLRIKSLLEKNNMNQKELSEKLDITEATLSRYINGQRKPTGDTLIKLSQILDTTTDYILKGNDKSAERFLETRCLDVDLSSLQKLNIIGTVCAGKGRQAYEEKIGEEYAYIENANPLEHFYLKIKGDSMEPKISAGDLALVHRQNDVDSGDLAIVLVNDEDGVIKKVIKNPNSIELHSFNPYYPTREFKGEEMNSIKIIGKVLKIISSW